MTAERASCLDSIANKMQKISEYIFLVDEPERKTLISKVINLHIVDESAIYWWTSLRISESFHYDRNHAAWCTKMEELLAGMSDEVFLVITDDEPGPWPVLKFKCKKEVCRVIADLNFFEYFLFSSDCSKIVFDTHENNLVYSGYN